MNIPIFVASDENYAPFLCTTMYSVLENTKESIDFIVLANKITDNSKVKIEKSLEKFNNKTIEYIDISKFNLERFPNLRHYSINTFARYFIPEIKPELKKAIYLDSDIIVKGDIKELFIEDLKENILGAVSEDFYEQNGIYLKEKIYPNYKNTKNYFNAGVLLINIEELIKTNLMKTCIDKTIELSDLLSCPDQDILNIVFENKTKLINIKFNYMGDFYKTYQKFFGKKQAIENDKNAIILHYVVKKPWQYKTRFYKDFWNIAKKTQFIKEVKKIYEDYDFRLKWWEYIFSKKILKSRQRKLTCILGIKIKSKLPESVELK